MKPPWAPLVGIKLVVEPEDSALRSLNIIRKGTALSVNGYYDPYGSRITFFDQEDLDEFKRVVREQESKLPVD